MVWKVECDCFERTETSIDSIKVFQELKDFFQEQVNKEIFIEKIPQQPYYVWNDEGETIKWFATKWYKCRKCNCLWEFNYPDFPIRGFVRKFDDGIYKGRGF
ncbi:hypothetical protein AAK894_02225 [Lachnospiraceae bacterium 46-61]